ncbi:MAG: hypothetical protein FGM29_02325 [Actinobacteria bacterium]|nr:hypothetical protein [Actinomycetota bacterium]
MADELMQLRLGSWTAWAGDRSSWPVTTPGAAAVEWAIDVHREFFGDGLLGRMLDDGPPHPFVDPLRWPLSSVHAIVELLSRACALRVIPRDVGLAIAGSTTTADVNRRVTSDLHVLEVAGLAVRHGWSIDYEAALSTGRRPDLRLVLGNSDIRVEVTSSGPDRQRLAAEALSGSLVPALMMIGVQHEVEISGSAASSEVDGDDLARLVREVEAAASESAASGEVRTLAAHGVELSIRPGGSGLGSFDGPPLTGDMWPRLKNRLRTKAAQTEGAGAAWICVQDRSGLFQLTDLAGVDEHEQLRRLAENVSFALRDARHVAGVLLSTGVRIDAGEDDHDTILADDDGRLAGSRVLRRRLPGGRCRRTFVVRLRNGPAADDGPMHWFRREGSWLDWALAAAGLPTVESIFGSGQ